MSGPNFHQLIQFESEGHLEIEQHLHFTQRPSIGLATVNDLRGALQAAPPMSSLYHVLQFQEHVNKKGWNMSDLQFSSHAGIVFPEMRGGGSYQTRCILSHQHHLVTTFP